MNPRFSSVLTKLFATEFSQDHADLGAVLNGFSLSESGALATSIEKTGQAVDATYVSTARLVIIAASRYYAILTNI